MLKNGLIHIKNLAVFTRHDFKGMFGHFQHRIQSKKTKLIILKNKFFHIFVFFSLLPPMYFPNVFFFSTCLFYIQQIFHKNKFKASPSFLQKNHEVLKHFRHMFRVQPNIYNGALTENHQLFQQNTPRWTFD